MAEVLAPEGQQYFASSALRRSPPSTTFLAGSPNSYAELQHAYAGVRHSGAPSSTSSSCPPSLHGSHIDLSKATSILSTPATSFSLDSSESEEELSFPSYDDDTSSSDEAPEHGRSGISPVADPPNTQSSDSNTTPTNTPEFPHSEDDTAVRDKPTRHVDYLSHEWREEDIWASWKHIVSQRKVYGEHSRLENASWRTWAKQKWKLRTIPPEKLNWLKDVDVTWLYGPLQTSRQTSEPASALSKSNSFLNKKPILKKRSMSEMMLQKSISTSSLVKAAVASVKAQEDLSVRRPGRPGLGVRAASDFVTSAIPSKTVSRDASDFYSSHSTSGLHTPADGEKRHIRFDEKVEQCIAVDIKDVDEDEPERAKHTAADEDSSSDDGVVMMKADRKKPMSRSNSRSSLLGEGKTIAMLPSTTLKYRTDSPDIPEHHHSVGPSFWRGSRISPSPSQETLRPSNPSTNFLLHDEEDEDEDEDISWEPSAAFSNRVDSLEQLDRQYARVERGPTDDGAAHLKRTPSGMFMPFEPDEEEAANRGLFGTVIDGVNTARDIAHVIWNVGWRSPGS